MRVRTRLAKPAAVLVCLVLICCATLPVPAYAAQPRQRTHQSLPLWHERQFAPAVRQAGSSPSTLGREADGDFAALRTPITFAAIAAGYNHTCALTTDGGVQCWGHNGAGQLGDGSRTTQLIPTAVYGLTNGVTAIAAGRQHTCALTATGGVKCWGFNWYGQVGDGKQMDASTPQDVIGLDSGATAVAAGGNHTCALTTMGGVKCWGGNDAGQLGDGTTEDRLTPVDVSDLTSGVTAITAGNNHTCALTVGGGVKCWGGGLSPLEGDQAWGDQLTPVDVAGLTAGVQAIAAGYKHTCALTTAGGVKCWGYNAEGQVGVNPGWIAVEVFVENAAAYLPIVAD